MELVKGVPITEYCDHKKLTVNDRLKLFIDVCRGVQHAHQKGIIHRDLKPSNILVAEYDHRPVVKIIDFGVAKALNQRLTEQTLFTHYGSVIGTMQYMSPEQAKFNQLDVDTRSDVYSLGAVLYELLTGSTPIAKERVQSASFEEVIRWIREEEPSKPSTKVGSNDSSSDKLIDHKADVTRLSRLIRGDLDWIVMKALEKDRDRRYDSASEMGDDLQRFLNQEPVLASPPSITYKTHKFINRNRTAVLGTGLIAALMVIAIGSLIQSHFNRSDRDRIAAEIKLNQISLQAERKETDEKERLHQADQQLREETIPAIESAVESGDNIIAFQLASTAIKQFPSDERLRQVMTTVSSRWVVITDPPNATVRLWAYEQADQQPIAEGKTPLTIDVAKGVYRYRIDREGHETIEGCAGPDVVSLDRLLDPKGTIPDSMVRIPASAAAGIATDFLIDRHEVTNRQFKQFVDKGAYRQEWIWGGAVGFGRSWKEKTAGFVDSTQKPGPRFWENGNYADGEGDLPVVGISWAEAAAYARFREKRLPSIHHWNLACGHELTPAMMTQSNLGTDRLLPVGKSKCIGPFGTLDMIGNVAEWCFNSYGENARTIGGSSFRGPAYTTRANTPLTSGTREDSVGFRCIKLMGPMSQNLFTGLTDDTGTPFDGRDPISDQAFNILRGRFDYDKTKPLNVKLDETQESFFPGVTRETYRFDTAYESQMIAYVYRSSGPIPTNP